MTNLVRTAVAKGTSTNFSVGYSNSSGTDPVSGVSGVGDFSGPWYVERQSLSYEYVRVPWASWNQTTDGHVSLSSLGVNTNINGTKLLVKITDCLYESKKVYDWFSVSSYTVPQKFTLYSVSADETGTTYGTPAAGTMSVKGSVVTTQEWYHRREWNDDTDAEIGPVKFFDQNGNNSYVTAYNYHPINNVDCSTAPSYRNVNNNFEGVVGMEWPWDQGLFWANPGGTSYGSRLTVLGSRNNNNPGKFSCAPGDVVGQSFTNFVVTHWLGHKPGAYQSSQDSAGDVQMITDQLGSLLKSYPFPDGTTPTGLVTEPYGIPVRNFYYEKSRHWWGG